MATRLTESTFLSGANSAFIEQLYARYLKDPGSVDPGWARFFAGLDDDAQEVLKELEGASWSPRKSRLVSNGETMAEAKAELAPTPPQTVDQDSIRAATLDSIRALMLIRAYRVRGHLIADLDPLGIEGNAHRPELDPAAYGFTEADYDHEIFINYVLGLETATLGMILEVVKETYCGSVGVEFMHIQEPDEKSWIQENVEAPRNRLELRPDQKKAIFGDLTDSEGFETFLQVKYTGTKRFGLEGAEATIPALEEIIHRASQLGVKEVVLGMPHRGRLN
ncbi:MAG: 2-oxoglutarate dehydrogenase E1 component, partial [Alphaproteobacteria bacterium]